MKKKLQKIKQKLTSEEARTWGRGIASVSFALVGMFTLVGTVFYATLTAYVWRDGVEVVDTLPKMLLEPEAHKLAEITQELGNITSVAGFALIAIIGAVLTWGSFDAWRRIINYNAKLAREKKENEKEA